MSTPVRPLTAENRTDSIAVPRLLDDQTEKRIDEIEMIGEEQAANLPAPGQSGVTAGMRYLAFQPHHSSACHRPQPRRGHLSRRCLAALHGFDGHAQRPAGREPEPPRTTR